MIKYIYFILKKCSIRLYLDNNQTNLFNDLPNVWIKLCYNIN